MSTGNRASVRKSLPLSEHDLGDLALVRASEAHRVALSQLIDVELTDESSEAALMHALMAVGIKAVQQQVEAHGYAQIAAEMDTTAHQAAARRRRPTWAEE
jgi:hypothetical protein